jgi:hypothetical protein
MVMKKIVIPTVLAATIIVAGMFAFMPVQRAATVHSTITGAMDIQDIFASQADANTVTVDLQLVRQDGTFVAGATFTASSVVGGLGTITVTEAAESNGVYRLTLDTQNNLPVGRSDISLRASAGDDVAWALVVVEV